MRLKSEHEAHKKAKIFADIFSDYKQKYQNLEWYQAKNIPILSEARGKIVLLDDISYSEKFDENISNGSIGNFGFIFSNPKSDNNWKRINFGIGINIGKQCRRPQM